MSEGSEVIVVGAGLSGLTAALNLARDGKEVLVVEKFDHICGTPLAHPAVDVTPMEPDKLGRFIGVELGKPQVTMCESFTVYAYGYKVPMDQTHMQLYCVDRGTGKNTLDKLLYDLCLEAGVRFEFGKPLVGQTDFASLPPDSIIATGLYVEAFEALRVPYQKVFGYIGRGRTDSGALATVWFHDYTLDYAYYGTANGVLFCLFFAREPVRESEWEMFKEQQLKGQEDMECDRWVYHEGLVPSASYVNPRMFAGDKILAGTLSGMMDPFALFGVQGSLLSGKIAALAHRDKAEAYALFKRYTRLFKRNLFAKRVFDGSPVWLKKKTLGPQLRFLQEHSDILNRLPFDPFDGVPGYRDLP